MKTFALMTALMLTTALAHARGDKKWGGEGDRGEKMRQELGLNDEQVKQMKALRDKNHEAGKELRQKAKAAKEDLHQAMRNPSATNEELQTKFDAAEQAKNDAHRKFFTHMLEVRKILTEEQRAKFHAKRKEWKEKHKSKKG